MATKGSVKTTLAMSASLVTGTPTQAKYEALAFSPCGEVVDLGEFGPEYEMVRSRAISGGGTKKYKGAVDEGSLAVELLFDGADAGQAVLEEAAASRSKYAVRVSLPPDENGSVETYYFQVLVQSLKRLVGGAADAIRLRVLLAIDETAVIRSGAPPVSPGAPPPPPPGAVIVEDEGTALATAATTLNFTGAGVTASGAGAEKTINIPGAATPPSNGTHRTASHVLATSDIGKWNSFYSTGTIDVSLDGALGNIGDRLVLACRTQGNNSVNLKWVSGTLKLFSCRGIATLTAAGTSEMIGSGGNQRGVFSAVKTGSTEWTVREGIWPPY